MCTLCSIHDRLLEMCTRTCLNRPYVTPASQLDISMEMMVYALSVGNYITKLVASLEAIEHGQGCLPLTEQELPGGVKAAKVWSQGDGQ